MKSYFVKIVACLLLSVMLLSVFVGCDKNDAEAPAETTPPAADPAPSVSEENLPFEQKSEIQKAFYLLNRDDTNLPNVDSMTMDMTMTISGVSSGLALEATAVYQSVYQGMQTGENFAYVETATMNMNVGNGIYQLTQITQSGYFDGKMFEYSFDSQTNDPIGFYSSLSAADYVAHKRAVGSDTDFEITQKTCATITCKKNSDGGYTATFGDFTAEGVDQFDDMTAAFEEALNTTVTDLVFTLSVDKDLLPKTLTIAFEFKEEDKISAISVSATYSKYNQTSVPTVDFTGYRAVSDLRAADLLEDALAETEEATKTKFDFSSSSTLIYTGVNDVLVSQEARVQTMNSGGKYAFDVEAMISDEVYSYTYQNGQMTTTYQGEDPYRQTITDSSAKDFISTYFLDTAQFSTLSCSAIGGSNGTYVFHISSPDVSILSGELDWLAMTEANITAASGTLTVTIWDGRITSYRYELILNLYQHGSSYTLTYSSVANNFVYS